MAVLLIVDGLSSRVTDHELRILFEQFGTVLSARVVRDGGGQSLNFGFVDMQSPEQAQQAVAQLNGYVLDGHRLVVSFVSEGPANP
jgi:RNA recognition motif-containing protein